MVYIFFAEGFEEIEALAPMDFLRRAKIPVTSVSLSPGAVKGAHGISVVPDAVFSDVNFSDAEVIVLPGGMPGTVNLDQFPAISDLLSSVWSKGGYLAAICAAPTILAKRGYLTEKEAICYPGFRIEDYGARISEKSVVRDGRIITAKSAGVAWQFAYSVAEIFVGREVCEKVREDLFLLPFGE